MDKSKMNAVERDLVEGLEAFATDLKAGVDIESKYTSRKVILDLEPQCYSAEGVKATRALLNVSQAIFAQFLGVSVKSVRAWEHGKQPSDMACRFMDEIQRNPDHYRECLKRAIKVKPCEA